jgi:lipoate-protein ligase B
MSKLYYTDLGLIDYDDCLAAQRRMVELRLAGGAEDSLLLLEHAPVITVGTKGGEENLLVAPDRLERAGVKLHRTDRGGNITYHGPGQLVGYPIFDLRSHGKDVHLFLRNLEQVVIDVLADFGIAGERSPGLTGVWVGGDKICSIGVAVRRWISYHGFALNVAPNFGHWALIHPCGLVGKRVTSMERLIGRSLDMDAVKRSTIDKFAKVFALSPMQIDGLPWKQDVNVKGSIEG